MGSSAFDFRDESWREVKLSSWLDDDEMVVFIPVFLWDLARKGGVAAVGVQHGIGLASTKDGALEGE